MIEPLLNLNGAERFAAAFGIVALFTRKDLAWYCFGASILSMFVHDSTMTYEAKITSYSLITFIMAIGSAAHYRISGHALPIVISAICCLTLINQFFQVMEWTDGRYLISNMLGVSMLTSLMFMDGRKGLLHDLANDINSYSNNSPNSSSSNRNGKGCP